MGLVKRKRIARIPVRLKGGWKVSDYSLKKNWVVATYVKPKKGRRKKRR